MKRSSLTLIPLLSAVLLLGGCGIVRIDANSEAYPIVKEVVPSYKAGQTIKVSNYYNKPEIVVLKPEKIDGDLKQYTETAITLLEQGLKHQNVKVAADASKSVKLRVYNVKYDYAFWTIRADVNIATELGNGESFTVFHHNASPSDGWSAVSGAITRATEKVLKHPKFIMYMNE